MIAENLWEICLYIGRTPRNTPLLSTTPAICYDTFNGGEYNGDKGHNIRTSHEKGIIPG